MTQLAAAETALEELREQVRADLAADLGREPEDYDATRRPVSDGGE